MPQIRKRQKTNKGGFLMVKLRIMRKTVKARYAAEGRDRCAACYESIQVGDEYTRTGQSGGKRRLLYCRACAEEKGIL